MRLYGQGLITVASRLRSVILTFNNDRVTRRMRYRIQKSSNQFNEGAPIEKKKKKRKKNF